MLLPPFKCLLTFLLLGLCIASPVQKRRTRKSVQMSASSSSATTSEIVSTSTAQRRPPRYLSSEQTRKEAVVMLESIYSDLQARVLSRDLTTLTREEQLEVAVVRLKLQTRIDNFKRYEYKVPYIAPLLEKLRGMKAGLPMYTDYIDWDNYEAEKKRKNSEAGARFRTRKKAAKYGINIAPPSRGLREDAPAEIKLRRNNKNRSRRNIRERKAREAERSRRREAKSVVTHDEPKDLLVNGWGGKKPRYH